MAGFEMRRAQLSLLLALGATVAFSALVDWRVGAAREQAFGGEVRRMAYQLLTLPALNQAQGAALVAAGISTRVRELVRVGYPADPREVEGMLRAVAVGVGARDGFVLDGHGIILAHYTDSGHPGTGHSVATRPYFKAALGGRASMYAAFGSNTQSRGIYVAAPLRAGDDGDARVIGAVVLKAGFDDVDKLLGSARGAFALLSPEGVVFASNVSAWLYSIAAEPARLPEIAANERIASYFDNHARRRLSDLAPLAGAVASPVAWGDPQGAWTLLGLPAERMGLNLAEAVLTLTLSGALCFGIQAWFAQRWRRELERRRAAQDLAGYARRLEHIAERRARLAAIATELQQAGNGATLGRRFLTHASQLLGMQLASLYHVDGEQRDTLVFCAGYGCDPEAGLPARVAFGDGLLGQCAVERERIVLSGAPDAYWRIRSGVGEARAGMLVLAPVLLDAELVGVLELAALKPLDAAALDWLAELLPLLATNLAIVLAKARTEQLLASAIAQTARAGPAGSVMP
ncbi:two-component system C4-dicarboxylate transport sensor histidine kinase DctB [Oxalobacteraceae bacterium GrIS 1.11]